jgi:altronate dehydratase
MIKHENCAFGNCPATNDVCKDKCKCPNNTAVKLVGITCDHYKVSKFSKNLKKNGFENFEIKEQQLFTIIRVAVFTKDLNKLKKVIEATDASFRK